MAPDYLRTLFLHPPSADGFDGGAGSRYQARREIRSFWYSDLAAPSPPRWCRGRAWWTPRPTASPSTTCGPSRGSTTSA